MSRRLIWITGLSGAGKTTIARELSARLTQPHIWLDGDRFREIMGGDLGHGPEDRLKNAYRIARMCHYLVEQGHLVICSTMSLYNEIHEFNRDKVAHYFEVYVECALQELMCRNQKGLYEEGSDLPGVSIPYQRPKNPHLVIDNTDRVGLKEKVEEILNAISL